MFLNLDNGEHMPSSRPYSGGRPYVGHPIGFPEVEDLQSRLLRSFRNQTHLGVLEQASLTPQHPVISTNLWKGENDLNLP